MIARRISFLLTILSPGRELGFEAFFAYDLAPFAAAQFTVVGLPFILFFFNLKIVFREVFFRFGRPLLVMANAIGAAVAGGLGASTGVISLGSMLYV